MECVDVRALPAPFSLEAPQFAPHASNGDRADPKRPVLNCEDPRMTPNGLNGACVFAAVIDKRRL